jgi:CheY-like chemotaxis protein
VLTQPGSSREVPPSPGFRYLLAVEVGLNMFFSWRRTLSRLAKTRSLTLRRRPLTFERLEDRCLLSGRPVVPLDAAPLIAREPGQDLQPLSSSNSLVPSPSQAADGTRALSVVPETINETVPPIVSNRPAVHAVADLVGTLAAAKIIPPDSHNAPTPQKPHIITSDDSQNAPLSDASESSAGNGKSPKPLTHALSELAVGTAGLQIDGPVVSVANLPTGPHRTGRNALLPGSLTILAAGVSGDKLVLRTDHALRVNSGLLTNQGKTGNSLTRHSAVNVISLAPGGSGSSGARTGTGGALQNDDNSLGFRDAALFRWLSGSWTEEVQNSHVAEALAYPNGVIGPNQSPNVPSPTGAFERLLNVSAGTGGVDRGLQASVYPVNVSGLFHAETLTGGDNEAGEKPAGGTVALAAPVPGLAAESGAPISAESAHRELLVSIGMAALVNDFLPSQETMSLDAANGVHLIKDPSKGAGASPVLASTVPSLHPEGSMARFEPFQMDVVATAPVSNDGVMAGTAGSTAVYLANEESSIWSIVTTYALVIIPRQRRHQPTILVVDPDDATRDALNVALVREGYFVLPAASVRDAWGTLRTPHARIDLVLMDPHLPDVSGIHLCARLREISPTLPVMVCAGDVEPGEVAQLQQLGVRYYLRKPVAFEELLHTVKTLLR